MADRAEVPEPLPINGLQSQSADFAPIVFQRLFPGLSNRADGEGAL
jgi:hypothetical protein